MSPGRHVSRRALLGGALGVAAAGAAGGVAVSTTRDRTATTGDAMDTAASEPVAYAGPHQPGVVEHPRAFGLMAAFRCVAASRTEVADTMRALTATARQLVEGRTPVPEGGWAPPTDTGVLGTRARTGLLATVALGASMFDDRYGLADRAPRELVAMPFLANDRLDPARTHGDVLLTLQADRPDALQHGLRQLMRATRAWLVPHWVLDGYSRPDEQPRAGRTDNRNLMGFKDGTANPDGSDTALMDRLVWVGGDQGEPAWAVGGTYQAVRVVRMFVEQWDRTPLREQEQVFGREKVSGAPLGQARERDEPDYTDDPRGRRIPLDAHIRLANPRRPQDENRRILRRGFSFAHGADAAGTLDQGLAFVSYQRRLAHFLEIAERLAGEPLEEYVLPVGGGFFFVPPGVRGDGDWLARDLLRA